MSDPAFFGYGSLVNLGTHDYADPRPATLHGWRRVWRGTDLREIAYLSVEPARDTVITGIIAQVPGNDWTALDAREAAYQRHDVTALTQPRTRQTAVYRVRPEHLAKSAGHPILLSYLDTVVQGFLQLYGEQGVAEFFATTGGWEAPILDDRDAPIYPRAQVLTTSERALVDHHLSAMMQQAE